MSTIEYAYGAFAGMLVGDAAGAPLEFYPDKITKKLVRRAMRMPGGGVLQVGPGQITDDGELALSLGRALVNKNPNYGFPRESVFDSYHNWYLSDPFDIGYTCTVAFSHSTPGLNYECVQKSESNGALMRIIALPIWARNQSEETIAEYARQDALLSHPNKVTQDVNVVYSLGIAYLLNYPGDYSGCYEYLEEYVMKNIKSKVKKWFFEAHYQPEDVTYNIGHSRWAFQLAIYHLERGTKYAQAINSVLLKGGDTDTNAAIVGGMVGAIHGIKGIPKYMLNPVMDFDPQNVKGIGYTRPERYRAQNYRQIVDNYYNIF